MEYDFFDGEYREVGIESIKNIVDYGVIGLLAVLSVMTLAYAIERFFYFSKINLRNYPNRKILELDLSRHLGAIATIGSSAPYIGLLGTVLAIILTFYSLGEQNSAIDTARIMKHLALALKATAAGLLVAIPASVLYNILMDKADRLITQWEILNGSER